MPSGSSRPTPTAPPTPTSCRSRCPAYWDIDLYLKDESTHPTGSLKHRLARSLFLYALCNGWIGPGAPFVEASSGSTAVCEAYFARMLGLPFIAVMPRSTVGREDRADRVPRRPLPLRRRPGAGVCRGARARRGVRRSLHGPVHLRRTGDRLAGQQQHRRVDLRADGAERIPCPRGSSSAPAPAARPRPSAASSAIAASDPALPRRPGGLGVLHAWRTGDRTVHRPRLADRGHRPPARRAVLRAGGGRPHGRGSRCRIDRRDPRDRAVARSAGGCVDRHDCLRGAAYRVRDACQAGTRQHRDPLVRRWRALRRHLLFDDAWVAETGMDLTPTRVALEEFLAGRVAELPVLEQAHRDDSVRASPPASHVQ